jgi:hypothetical protein
VWVKSLQQRLVSVAVLTLVSSSHLVAALRNPTAGNPPSPCCCSQYPSSRPARLPSSPPAVRPAAAPQIVHAASATAPVGPPPVIPHAVDEDQGNGCTASCGHQGHGFMASCASIACVWRALSDSTSSAASTSAVVLGACYLLASTQCLWFTIHRPEGCLNLKLETKAYVPGSVSFLRISGIIKNRQGGWYAQL